MDPIFMKCFYKVIKFFFLQVLIFPLLFSCHSPEIKFKVLVFSKTSGFRHASIEAGIEAIQKLGEKHGLEVDATEDAAVFTEKRLKGYHVVIFLNTTGDVLDKSQQNDFERFIQAGGGFVGIHSATDTEYGWPWYGKMTGAYFDSHPNNPNVLKADLHVVDKHHWATDSLPDVWTREDEFYNFKDFNEDVNVLLKIDESSYSGGTNGENHPMAWYHEYDGGRAFYTSLGHTNETFSDPLFLKHLFGGIIYAAGGKKPVKLNYKKAHTLRVPEENRFSKVVLANNLEEPMELAVMDDGKVIFVERKGKVKIYYPEEKTIKEIAKIPVNTKYKPKNGSQREAEDGLLGIVLDPDFKNNKWVYFYYSPEGEKEINVLARYELKGDLLDESSKKIILEIPVQRDECCHTGGSMAFDAQGNLYLSTGDNTNPFGTSYSPLDERPGRSAWDAQRSSANTNDLRGKILKIKPLPDGSYTIPEGNLFAEGGPKTRPEIYTMGHRNPFRIAVDKKSGYLYWGDIGPDATKDSLGWGTKGMDEFNQARKPGNYGWPYLLGNNFAYNYFNFENNTSRAKFDPDKLENTSPNNTGLINLPKGQEAFFWYAYDESKEFPLFGSGGRSAMAGPVYRKEDYKNSDKAFPAYYNGKWFIYEWVRGWVIAVTLDENGDFLEMEPFMPGHRFSSPIDMEFGPEGELYILEYGKSWFKQNEDARLVKIEYNAGNRIPVAQAECDKKAGALPLKVQFSSEGSFDPDGDDVQFKWEILTSEGAQFAVLKGENPEFTFSAPDIYDVKLTVTDQSGGASSTSLKIVAGNEPPKIKFDIVRGNKTFYLPGHTFDYNVYVEDKEDGSLEEGQIKPDEVSLSIDYLKEGFDKVAIAQGHQDADNLVSFSRGKDLIEANSCKSCHGLNSKSVGPSYFDVAERYHNKQETAVSQLASKIIGGGSGSWGEVPMPSHSNLKEEEAKEIVKYILGLVAAGKANDVLPLKGSYLFNDPDAKKPVGAYFLRASYLDKGANGLPGTRGSDVIVLRSPVVSSFDADEMAGVQKIDLQSPPLKMVIAKGASSSIGFKAIDLSDIGKVEFLVRASKRHGHLGGVIEVRLGSPTGKLIGTSSEVKVSEQVSNDPQKVLAVLDPTEGIQDVYFVFTKSEADASQSLFAVSDAEFKAKTIQK